MNIKKILLLLCLSILMNNISPGQDNSGTKTKTHQDIRRYLKKLKETKESPPRVKVLLELFKAYTHFDLEKARDYVIQGIELSKKINYQKGIADGFHAMGTIYYSQGNYSRSLEFYSKSLNIYEELGDQNGFGGIHNSIGDVYLKQKEFSRALDFYLKGKDIFGEIGNKQRLAYSYCGIGECYKAAGANKKAVDYLTRGCKIGQAINSPDIVKNAAGKLSQAYAQMGQYNQAYQYYVLFKDKHDSLRNEAIVKRITQLEMQYEFEKKQKQQELEQKKKDMQKEAELRQQRFLKYTFSGIAVLLALVFYTRSRLKITVNRKLNKEIRERKHAEERLRQNEEKFRALAEKSVVGICIIQDNTIQYANPKFLELFQYAEGEVIGKNPLELVIEEDRSGVSRNLEKHRAEMPDSTAFEFTGVTKDDDIIYLEAHGTLTRYQDKPALLETVINITDRKKAETELLRSMKLETVGILSGGIAHDFNNLLIIISLNLELLKKNLNKPRPQPDIFVENMEWASNQAVQLVNKFITIAEGGWILKNNVDLAAILKDALVSSPQIKDIPCTISLAKDLKPVDGDERHLRQVLVNLLLNAHEASSAINEQEIHISAQNMVTSTDNQWSLPGGEYVKISVIDNGKGIPGDSLAKIFDPYFSTKKMGIQKGMGLGLSLCYAIVKKHGGHISVSSVLHKGTTVDLYLPVYHEK